MFLSHPRLLRTKNLFGTSVYLMNSPKDQNKKYYVYSLKFKKINHINGKSKTSNIAGHCSDNIYKEGVTMEK